MRDKMKKPKVSFRSVKTPIILLRGPKTPPCPDGLNIGLWDSFHRMVNETHGCFPDIRTILTNNAICDVQREEDEYFMKAVMSCVK